MLKYSYMLENTGRAMGDAVQAQIMGAIRGNNAPTSPISDGLPLQYDIPTLEERLNSPMRASEFFDMGGTLI